MSGISAVIPVYNETLALQDTVRRLDAALRGVCGADGYEVVLVDDGSTDGAFDALVLPPSARLLRHRANRGYGAALKTGIRNARREAILICDADGTYPIEELPRLAAAYVPGALVVAHRQTIWYPRARRLKQLLRAALKTWLLALTWRWIPDINSGFRLFPRETAAGMLEELSDRFSFTTGQTLLWLYSGRSVLYVRAPYARRRGESKVSFLKDGVRVLQQTFRLTWRHAPLRLAAVAAAAGALALALL